MLAYFIILVAAAARFVPHMPNAAPITAIAIFGGAFLPKRQAFGITLLARFASDCFLGFFSWPIMLAVYASHLAGVLFGAWIKPVKPGVILNPSANGGVKFEPTKVALKIILSALGASLVFFLATNFAFLYSNYPHTWAGIAQAYVNGLPFLRGTVAGDLGYTLALFGVMKVAYSGSLKTNQPAAVAHL